MSNNNNTSGFSRRSFMQRAGVVGITGLSLPAWMPRMAFASSPDTVTAGDTLICVFLRGGMDGLSAVVPYNEADYFDQRPTIAVPDNKVLDLDGQFGLHPKMSPLHEIYQQQDLAIVQAVGSPDPTRSHFTAMDFMERGTPGETTLHTGWIGRHLQTTAERNNSPFRAVGMGNKLQTSLRGPVQASVFKSIADFHLRGRGRDVEEARVALESLYQLGQGSDPRDGTYQMLADEAGGTFEAARALEALDDSTYIPQNGAKYNKKSALGRSLSQVAQLIRADVGLEVACADAGGWDTHQFMGTHNSGRMATLLQNLAADLNAFYTDMGDLMSGITVMVMSEFGRRAYENGSRGTDHGHGNCMFLMGGSIVGGHVYTDWPGLAPENLDRGDLAITTDYRDVLSEVIQMRLDNTALDTIFPGYTPTYLGVAGAPTPISAANAGHRAIDITTNAPHFSEPMMTGKLVGEADMESEMLLDELMMDEDSSGMMMGEDLFVDEPQDELLADLLSETAEDVSSTEQTNRVFLPIIK
ncbi:MAG: DUF1501 domain-containing protein [Chloroflexota bacterium]